MIGKRLAIAAGSVVVAVAIVAVAIVGFTSVPHTVAEVGPAAHTPAGTAPTGTPSAAPSPTATMVAVASAGPSVSAAPVPARPAIGPSGNTMSAEWIVGIHESISSGNTAALEQECATWVHIITTEGVNKVVAGTDAWESFTAGIDDSAVDTTWNWHLAAASLAAFRGGPYGKYFPTDGVIGISSRGTLVAFTVVGRLITAVLISRHLAALR